MPLDTCIAHVGEYYSSLPGQHLCQGRQSPGEPLAGRGVAGGAQTTAGVVAAVFSGQNPGFGRRRSGMARQGGRGGSGKEAV
jgi:hypothetical protein